MHNEKKRISPLLILCYILSVTTLAVIILCIIIASKYKNTTKKADEKKAPVTTVLPGEKSYSQSEVDFLIASASENATSMEEARIKENIRSVMSQKNPNTGELLRTLFPEYVVYIANDGYHFDTISDVIPHNGYSKDNINVDDDGFITYINSDGNPSKKGIDVSQHQGKIDWEKVKEAGIEFAIIRVGFRGYGSGALVLDEQFVANIEGARDNGIDVGVYFFSQAVSEEEILEEVDFTLDAIKDYKISYPVVIDIEKIDDSSARGNNISKEDRTKYTALFCEKIKENGYSPMIYGNTYSLFAMLDMEQLYQYDVWFAFYNNYIYYPYIMKAWQYSDTLKIPGITGNCDLDIWMP